MQVNKDLWRALKEIMPSDRFEVKKVKKKGDIYVVYAEGEGYKYEIYVVYAEDEGYKYEIEISLSPRGDEQHYRLLDFSYEEKRK